MAAAGSASIEPKFPCPWIRGYRREKSWIKYNELEKKKLSLLVAKQTYITIKQISIASREHMAIKTFHHQARNMFVNLHIRTIERAPRAPI